MAGDEPPLERISRGTSRLPGRIADCRLQIADWAPLNLQSAICNLQIGRLPRETASGGAAAATPLRRKTATESSPAMSGLRTEGRVTQSSVLSPGVVRGERAG